MSFRTIVPLAALVLVGAVPAELVAQWTARPSENPRQIVVSATSTVEATPDRARLMVAVETRGQTGAAAAAENAKIQTAVLEAVGRVGVASPQIRTLAVTVNPEYRYPSDGGRPTIVGYHARNSIQIEVRDLAKVAAVIDGALARGATNVNGPTFFLSDPEATRREALQRAVRKARLEAEAITSAADVNLGQVLEIQVGEGGMSEPPMYARAMRLEAADAGPTPIESGSISVSASVTIRIALVQR